MTDRLGRIAMNCEAIADRLQTGLGQWNAPGTPAACAAEILGLTLNLPEGQRKDLTAPAKLLCDNLSHEVAIYSFLGQMVRSLEVCAAKRPEMIPSAEIRALRIKVMGN